MDERPVPKKRRFVFLQSFEFFWLGRVPRVVLLPP